MQKTLLSIGSIIILIGLMSCRHTEMPQNDNRASQLEDQSEKQEDTTEWTLGTVKHMNLEGGFWAIMGNDETRFAPASLAEAFCIEGLQVKFTFTDNSGPSFQMWGRRINLVKIEKLED